MAKNILLITYNFPPIGSVRALRRLQFLRHLSIDYSIDVLTIQPERGYGTYDKDIISLIPNI
ncbi:MAG: hypothetical protein QME40_05560 [bacterium]|nr:hypothetical protein [bacterium]